LDLLIGISLDKHSMAVIKNMSGHLGRFTCKVQGIWAQAELRYVAAQIMHTGAVKWMASDEMMQAETLDPTKPVNANAKDGLGTLRRARGLLEDPTNNFWRVVPVLFGLAAWLPQVWSSLAAISRTQIGAGLQAAQGGFIQSNILKLLGPDGLVIVGALLAALLAYSVWALARAIGAPRWAAALVASLCIVAPLFGLAPSPAIAPDDAAFGVFMTLALAGLVWTARREDSNCLMAAFVLAIIAAGLRPGAAWPAIAVGIGALLASDKLEEGPWFGMFSALCWAPGLYIAHHFIAGEQASASLFAQPAVIEAGRQGAAAGANVIYSATISLPIILAWVMSALPLVIFGMAALLGLGIAFLLGKGRRRGAIAGAVGGGLSVLGAAGYGNYDAARLLLDPIFLGLAAAIGLVIPALIARIKTARARSAAKTVRV
jgi:hypothetical protein